MKPAVDLLRALRGLGIQGLEHAIDVLEIDPTKTEIEGTVATEELSIPKRTMELEAALVRQALAQTSDNKPSAARLLEISYKSLLYKMRDYGIPGSGLNDRTQ